MNTLRPPLWQLTRAARQRGAGIIEMMVGVLIGMIVVAVVYNVLVLAEGYKRSTIGVADAQVTGQLTQYILGREIANGGAALMMGIEELIGCTDQRLKPLPVVIGSDPDPNKSDQLIVFYSVGTRVVHPVWFANNPAPLANTYPVNSPNGFKSQDWIIATDRAGTCALGRVTGVTQKDGSPWPPASSGGEVALSYLPVSAVPVNADSRVVNMGQQLMRMRYTINAAKAQLDSQNINWLDAGYPLPVIPLAQNVVLMKAQYGVDIDATGLNPQICWTPADNADVCGNGVNYSGPPPPPAAFDPTDPVGLGALAAGLNANTKPLRDRLRAIKAVRLAIVVRSEHQERQDALSASLVNQTAWLFNCGANDATCQSRIQIDNTVLNDYSRYRIYETVVPLRNSLWNQF